MEKYHVFDFDGTLVDSMPDWIRKVLRILENENIPHDPQIMIPKIVTLGDRKTAEYFQTLGVSGTVEDIIAQMDAYALVRYRDHILKKPFVSEYLAYLRQNGCKCYVFTASPHHLVDPCLARNGISEFFEKSWSTGDFGLTKNDVRIFELIAGEIGCRTEEIAFYDDSIYAVQTAKKAGCHVIGVYDDFSADAADRIKAFVDRYILSFDELMGE